MSWKSRSRRTFSMIELLVSIIVVAVIIAIAIIAYNAFIDNARQAAGEATTAQVVKTLQTYSAQENIAVVYAYPAPTDPGFTAVADAPADGEILISSLEYSDRVPGEVEKLRVAPGGTVAVVTADGVLCTTGAFGSEPGSAPASGPDCGDAVAPGDPSGLSAVPSNGQVLLSWTAPETVVQDYVVSYSPDGSAWSTFNDGVSTDTSVLVTGLTNGVEYQFRVVATNDVGSSAPLTTAATPFTVPNPPTALLATAGLESVTVAWTAPVFDGGRPVDSYTVTSSPGDLTCTTTVSSCVVEGLTAGQSYEFTVVAVNEAGGSASAGPVAPVDVPFTTTSAPGPLAAVLGVAAGEVDLAWGPPVDDGYSDVADYVVEYKLSADASWTVFTHPVSTTPSVTVTGLTVGESYDFRVKAVTAVSPNTNPYTQTASPLVTALAPDPATGLMVTPADSSVTLSWDEVVSTPQKPVTGYRIYAFNTVSTLWEFKAQTSSLTVDIPAVNGVTVSYRMATFGPGGEGPASASVDGTARTVPGAPTALAGTVGDASVNLSWTAPADNGGAPVTDYAIQYRTASGPGAWTTFADGPSTTPSATVTGLDNGTGYDFRVAAVNAAGTGAYTAADGPYTPVTTPGVPTGVTTTPGQGSMTVSWTAPASSGGAAITSYQVLASTGETCTSASTSCVVTIGTSATYSVRAQNSVGWGSYSSATASISPYNAATGGTVTTVSNYNGTGETWKVHTFTTSGTFNVTSGARSFRTLVVGGGGGGAGIQNVGGGGGGAGAATDSTRTIAAGSIAITVGAGGAGGVGPHVGGAAGGNGGTSSIAGVVSAAGGNGVASNTKTGGTSGSGFAGGTNTGPGGAGGGGATAVGIGNGGEYGTAGGAGLTTNISGSSQVFGTGGTGGRYQGGTSGPGANAAANTGNGGQGCGFGGAPTYRGGNGGSGIVIVAYRIG